MITKVKHAPLKKKRKVEKNIKKQEKITQNPIIPSTVG